MVAGLRKLRARLFGWNRDAWNHRRRLYLATPLLLLAGALASIFYQTGFARGIGATGYDMQVTLVHMIAVAFIGCVVLALVD